MSVWQRLSACEAVCTNIHIWKWKIHILARNFRHRSIEMNTKHRQFFFLYFGFIQMNTIVFFAKKKFVDWQKSDACTCLYFFQLQSFYVGLDNLLKSRESLLAKQKTFIKKMFKSKMSSAQKMTHYSYSLSSNEMFIGFNCINFMNENDQNAWIDSDTACISIHS